MGKRSRVVMLASIGAVMALLVPHGASALTTPVVGVGGTIVGQSTENAANVETCTATVALTANPVAHKATIVSTSVCAGFLALERAYFLVQLYDDGVARILDPTAQECRFFASPYPANHVFTCTKTVGYVGTVSHLIADTTQAYRLKIGGSGVWTAKVGSCFIGGTADPQGGRCEVSAHTYG